jgi:competence protein ComEA
MEAPPEKGSRPQQIVLAIALLVLAALLGYRAYGPRFSAQPTQELTASQKPVDLNKAGRAELVQVPGIGPNLAEAILNHRTQVGRFESLEDLQSVRGVGPKTMEKLKPWLTVEPGPAREGDDQVVQLARKQPIAVSATGSINGNKIRPGDPPINLNTASEAELQRLQGIGPALANRIALARDTKRFEKVDDLRRVKGIGAKTLESIRPFITVD